MTTAVTDASVAVKWLLAEENAAAARRLLRREYRRLAPTLLRTEVANALWKHSRRGDLDAATAQELYRLFERFPVALTDLRTLTRRALELAMETDRTVYDCAYLALAEAHGCQLITADERFYNAIRGTRYATTMLWVGDIP